jgi:hypothetical protein
MINQKFDILNKPVLSCYNAAYLVDYKNVELHRQYVEKYYGSREVNWFNREFMQPLLKNKKYKLILYYHTRSLSYDYELEISADMTIYYITKTLMTVN